MKSKFRIFEYSNRNRNLNYVNLLILTEIHIEIYFDYHPWL
jgi:hypothetical protein